MKLTYCNNTWSVRGSIDLLRTLTTCLVKAFCVLRKIYSLLPNIRCSAWGLHAGCKCNATWWRLRHMWSISKPMVSIQRWQSTLPEVRLGFQGHHLSLSARRCRPVASARILRVHLWICSVVHPTKLFTYFFCLSLLLSMPTYPSKFPLGWFTLHPMDLPIINFDGSDPCCVKARSIRSCEHIFCLPER